MKDDKHELIIVFKKDVAEEQSLKLMESFHVQFRKGMDSSKGKIYFYATGEKYIVTFGNTEEQSEFEKKRYQFSLEIHQIYTPDWNIQKD